MNILVKSTYPQTDGWGRAALDYLKAFTLTNHNVMATPIILSRQVGQVPSWVRQVTPDFKPDVVFQQCLPEYMVRYPAKNIGFAFTETRLLYRGWVDYLNKMDEVWVATKQEQQNFFDSGVHVNVEVVPMPMSLTKGQPLTMLSDIIRGRYTFYFVGEYVERKNIEALISAYYLAFKKEDDAFLIIKTNLGNMPGSDLKKYIGQTLDVLQKRMRLYDFPYKYPEILFLTERFTDEQMAGLHATCNCFINPSRGESTCRPLIDAALHNNGILCTEGIGSADEDLDIVLVKSREEPCSASTPPLPYLYSGRETWMEIDQLDLAEKLLMAYNIKLTSRNEDRINGKYSYSNTAARIERTV